jgi:hypothetical protein
MLTTTFDSYAEVMRVPYPPTFKERERNYGFVDVRGHPELAAKIKEAQRSPALKRLLMHLAQKGSPLLTLGCHIAEISESELGYPPRAAVTRRNEGDSNVTFHKAERRFFDWCR